MPMSTTRAKQLPIPLDPRLLMWLPAAALIVAGLLAATGFGLVPRSTAATTSSVTVGATVSKEVHVNLDDAGLCGPVSGSTSTKNFTGTTLSTSDGDVSLATCRLTFGSNNSALGATLLVESTRASGANSFCDAAATVTCPGPAAQFTDVDVATGEAPGTGAGQFGQGETATSGKFGIALTVNGGTCTGGMAANSNRHGLQQNTDAIVNGQTVCATSSMTDGDVTVDYRVNPGSAQPASTSYLVQTTYAVTAN